MTHDDAVARLLRRLLLRDNRLSSKHIDLTVRDGRVRLRGHVCSPVAKAAAGELASRLPGVCTILNDLDIVPPPKLPDATVAESVRAALEGHPRIVKDAITVAVHDGNVVLEGTVSGDGERLVALDVALGVDGARNVTGSLIIDPIRRIEDATMARDVKNSILDALRDLQIRVRVAISGGICVLSGQTATEAIRSSAENVARGFGLTTLRNEIEVEGQAPNVSDPSSPFNRPNVERSSGLTDQ